MHNAIKAYVLVKLLSEATFFICFDTLFRLSHLVFYYSILLHFIIAGSVNGIG